MGIPKFFRWMSERYPGLMQTAKEQDLPETDNFYLDMNGIIHNCSHPNDGDVHFRITETEMFEDIFNYISTLFNIIKPRGYFFLAVDGVAPRAKMNQQRGRRFRSAKEAYDREEAAIKKGDILPSEDRFDSNCITPGTDFMVKLNNQLKEFIKMKLATDIEWQKVKVILSGHETPGEGEHKIMDFIRYQRSQPGYNPNTRHCLYGLDTDLIMLGLSSHEPNFILLREEFKFTGKKNDASRGKSNRVDPTKVNFNILYLSLLRDYIEREFAPLQPSLSFKLDLESVIDDWILICFLIGNDFIPHIPHLHIHKNALPKIMEVYQSTLLKLDGYLNEKGILNMERFKIFAKNLAQVDLENYNILVKQNGGECAKDDFSKLNEFVRERIRIHGIRRDNHGNHNHNHYQHNHHQPSGNHHQPSGNHHQPSGNHYHQQYRNNGNSSGSNPRQQVKPNGGIETRSHHSHFQQSGVWTNIRRNNHGNSANNGGATANGGQNYQSPRAEVAVNHTPRRPLHAPVKAASAHNGKTSNGFSNNRVGVHSFTEEQINNSITVCADGDFIDLSDEEYLSDEKFPDGLSKRRQRAKDWAVRRSTPKKEIKKVEQKPKPSSELDDFRAYKRTYYREKFKIDPSKESVLKIVHEYVRALQWNLHYYYHGCVSWGWFYPYHYAPFISDVVNFGQVDVHFDLGEPFKPYDQLLSVLPAASSSLLPKVYRSLVTSTDSPLAHYFPTEVEYDLNGKQNDWEAVVLAPFIDEDALLKATVVCNFFLNSEEKANNAHGPHILFEYVPSRSAPGKRQTGYVKTKAIASNGFFLPMDKIKFGLLKSDKAAVKPNPTTRVYNRTYHSKRK